jgi:signal transduction histidine kinase
VRDLHDGAQQRLVHTIITLKFAQRALRRQPSCASSHGSLPSGLTAGGLRAGIDSVVSRLQLPVDVDVPAQRFPAEIEANAYFIVAEALTNVVKHSRAEHAGVRAYADDEKLHVGVSDDGVAASTPTAAGWWGSATAPRRWAGG